MNARRPTTAARPALACIFLAVAAACSDPASPSADGLQIRAAKPGSGSEPDPNPTSVQPPEAEQSQTLDVVITGENFGEPGELCEVNWLLAGVESSAIQTNSSSCVNTTQIDANITVAPDAPVEVFDVQVFVGRGRGRRGGIGSELFAVKVPPGQPSFTATITGDVSSVEPIGLPRHPGLQTDPESPATLDLSFFTTALTNGSTCFAAGNPFTGPLRVSVQKGLAARITFTFTAKDKDGMTKDYQLGLVGVIDDLANWPAIAGPSTITGESFNMHIATGSRRIACTGTGPLSFIIVVTRN